MYFRAVRNKHDDSIDPAPKLTATLKPWDGGHVSGYTAEELADLRLLGLKVERAGLNSDSCVPIFGPMGKPEIWNAIRACFIEVTQKAIDLSRQGRHGYFAFSGQDEPVEVAENEVEGIHQGQGALKSIGDWSSD